MSSIPQQIQMKLGQKSPIPRSRSDFNYVGLTSRDKRWTTDFSLLLPPFNRDSTGYSRLAETPVMLQPKPRPQTVAKLSKSPTLEPVIAKKTFNNDETPSSSLGRSKTMEPVSSPRCQKPTYTLEHVLSTSFSDTHGLTCRSLAMQPASTTGCSNSNKTPSRSSTMQPLSATSSDRNKLTSRSYTMQPVSPTNCSNGNKLPSRSPTLEPLSSTRCSDCNKLTSRSPTLEPYNLKCSFSNNPSMELNALRCPKACNRLRTNHLIPERNRPEAPVAGRHLMSIRKSPTMDTRTLRYSPLLNQHIISRSPTLDPSVLNRSPRCSHACGSRSPQHSRGVTDASGDVVRSQSMRSLQKGMERSPLKMRNSESAQSDVTCTFHKPYPLVEADEIDDEELHRLRNFSVTPKGLINWGDSFRSQSLTSVPGFEPTTSCSSSSQWDVASTRSYPMAHSKSLWNCSKSPPRYKVAMIGSEDVGKTSIIRQFQTSEYICAFDTSYDISKDYAITVILNKEESELEFVETRLPNEDRDDSEEKQPMNSSSIPSADAHVIIYSVTNRRSFSKALDLLTLVQKQFKRSAILLVGNKSDLVRVRAVTTDDGQTAAKEKNVSFIETSTAINHQVDELLVAVLTQIRAKCSKSSNESSSRWNSSQYSLAKAKGLIKKFLKKACFQSKSSDNLQRL